MISGTYTKEFFFFCLPLRWSCMILNWKYKRCICPTWKIFIFRNIETFYMPQHILCERFPQGQKICVGISFLFHCFWWKGLMQMSQCSLFFVGYFVHSLFRMLDHCKLLYTSGCMCMSPCCFVIAVKYLMIIAYCPQVNKMIAYCQLLTGDAMIFIHKHIACLFGAYRFVLALVSTGTRFWLELLNSGCLSHYCTATN